MTEHSDEICRHRWMTLCRGLNGEPFIRETGGGVFVVPVTNRDEVLFVIEPAVTDGTPVLWLPAGAIEPSETPVVAANRELQEEIGYKAARLDVLSELRPLARHGDWRVHAVLARALVPSKLMGDEGHHIKVESVPLSQFEGLIDAGRLLDSPCIAAVFLARRFMAAETNMRKQIGQQSVGT